MNFLAPSTTVVNRPSNSICLPIVHIYSREKKEYDKNLCSYRIFEINVSNPKKRNNQTNCFETNPKNRKKTKKRKKRKKRKNPKLSVKNNKICSLSNCFGWTSVSFGSIETSRLSDSVLKQNNRNKHFVSDSAETSFGSSFGCFESKLVSKDTLIPTFY